MKIDSLKNKIIKSRNLYYIGLIAFVFSVFTGKISKGELLHSVFSNISLFDFLSGFGAGIAITALMASIIVRRFCKSE